MLRRPETWATSRRVARRPIGWALVLGLVLVLFPAVDAPVQAADEACFLGSEGVSDCIDYSTSQVAGSDTLLSSAAYEAMTAGQASALRRLEDRAITAVREVHQLPVTDAPYIKAWARDEATGLLQKLVMKAVKTHPSARTPDQEMTASWLGGLLLERIKRVRLQEGEEFARWAGFDVATYWNLVESGASKAALTDFFSQRPIDSNESSVSTPTGGYCVYRPPAQYTDEYDPNTLQVCHVPCTNFLGCAPQPTHAQFVAWGAARAGAYAEIEDPALAVSAAAMAMAASEAGFVAREVLRQAYYGHQIYQDLVSELTTTPLEVTKHWAVRDIRWAAEELWEGLDETLAKNLSSAFKKFYRNGSMVALSEMMRWLRRTDNLSSLPPRIGPPVHAIRLNMASTIAARIQRIANAVRASAFGFSADLLIFALTAAVDGTILLVEQKELPGKIASDVVFARDERPDPFGWALLPGGEAQLRFEFVNAVATHPSTTPVRPTAPTDPRFVVEGLEDDTITRSSTLELGRIEDDQWTPVNVRVSGRWLVERWFHPEAGLDLQSLELHYANHNLQSEVAWLVPHEDGDYSFFVVSPEKPGFNRETCRADGTCWESEELRYLDAYGNPKVARLEGYEPAQGEALMNPTSPTVGQPVAFSAGSFRPGGAVSPVTYTWRYQQDGCGITCLGYTDGQLGAAYLPPVGGVTASHTWQEAGTYQVELTATDAEGRKATTVLSVHVTS